MSRLALTILLACSAAVSAQVVQPKYGPPVDLRSFKCQATPESSFIRRICYDRSTSRVLTTLRNTDYVFCQVPRQLVADWLDAESKGRFFNENVKGYQAYLCRP